jgi:beta-mannosidase
MDVDLVLSLKGEKEHNLKKTVTLNSGLNKNSYELEVSNPKLWYPQPIGNPYLYNFTLIVYKNDKELHNYSTKYGIREIELIQEPTLEGKSFVISINKKKVFCKGANWVPADSIPANVSGEKYRKLIELASQANFNMFRIWGGGIYEDPLFYQLCDEYGIMVWQDFMFACAPYPDDDSEFMQQVEKEVHAVIKELRNHPSLILWSGNNENQWIHHNGAWGGRKVRLYGDVIYNELLPKLCKILDPSRPYWPSSPYGGKDPNCQDEGDRHAWQMTLQSKDPYERVNFKRYVADKGKFITEFGHLAPSVRKSLLEFNPQKELYINSSIWKYHNNTFERGNMKAALERFFILQDKLSLEEYIISSQMLQAEALKFALEHWRRRMFNTAGVLFWMYSDCWGTTGGWTIVDYYLRLKPSYFYVKRAFEPLHISLKETSPIEVWITNDTYNTYPVDIEYGIKTFGGEELIKKCKQEKFSVGGARIVGKVDTAGISQGQRSRVFCYAKVYLKNELISQNRCFLVDFKDLELPEPKLKTVLKKISGSVYKLKLSSENFAWMVNIEFPGGISVNDDYFDIFPGENYEVSITTFKAISIADIGISTMNQVIRKYKK